MKHLTLIIMFLLLSTSLLAMTSPKDAEKLDGMNTYQIRVLGNSPVNIQGMVSYYDNNGKAQTTRFFGITPMVYEISSLEGIMAAVKINPAAPSFGAMRDMDGFPTRNTGRIRAILFKGSQFISEKSAFDDFGEITISNGKYPYENLGLMLLP